jgi:UrcA family protein
MINMISRGVAAFTLPAVLLVAAIASPCIAHADQKSATVSLAGLDLSTDQGLQAAHDRVRQKARWLCDRVVNPWAVSHQPDYVRCVDETTAAAVGKLQDALAAAHVRPRIQVVSIR